MTKETPTPETDAATFKILSSLQSGTEKVVHAEICAKLERELNEAREQLNAMRKEHNEVRANYVAMCSRLQECVQEHGIGLGGEKLDKLVCDEIKLLTKDLEEERHAWQKERENAMADYVAVATQLQAMREAIREVFNSFANNEPASDSAWLIRRESPWLDDRQTTALAKLQPFLP